MQKSGTKRVRLWSFRAFISYFTSSHDLQMFPQDLSSSAVRHQAQESLSVQATQLTTLQALQV